jgi:hypothetical protein
MGKQLGDPPPHVPSHWMTPPAQGLPKSGGRFGQCPSQATVPPQGHGFPALALDGSALHTPLQSFVPHAALDSGYAQLEP